MMNMEMNLEKLVIASNSFGIKLYSLLAKASGNICFSPFSIHGALSMLLHGAKEETETELQQALGFVTVDLSEDEIIASFKVLLSSFFQNNDAYIISVANAIIVQRGYQVTPEYEADAQNVYKASIMDADFIKESGSAVMKANDFVRECTYGKISAICERFMPSALMVLLNAIYFKGRWQFSFNEAKTQNEIFYNHGVLTGAKEVPFMHMERNIYYFQNENYSVIELPYKRGDINMLFILPREMNGLESLEDIVIRDFLKHVRHKLEKAVVNVFIPKIHVTYSRGFKPVLQALGIDSLFNHASNLRNMSNTGHLVVSDIFHKTVLDINEEGDEAASAMSLRMQRTFSSGKTVADFKVDHPFLFLIYDKTNHLIFFVGRMSEF